MKDIQGYEGVYAITRDGKVWSYPKTRQGAHDGKWLKPAILVSGYEAVSLWKSGKQKNFRVNRLVAMAYVPNPNNVTQVNHKNGKKRDNRASNLEWCTHSENVIHALKTGLSNNRGEGHRNAKLTSSEVIKIRSLREDGMAGRKIARLFNVSPRNIRDIHQNKTWKHLLLVS